MQKKLPVSLADVVNLTPAFQRCLNEPERYELTDDAHEYLAANRDHVTQTITRIITDSIRNKMN